MIESGIGDGENGATGCLSVARGGPVYVPNLVGPLTTVPDFEAALLHELQSLKAELSDGSSQSCNDYDISVDELKIFSEEELVDMAMKEAFKSEENCGSLSQPSVEQSNARSKDDIRRSSNARTCLENSGRVEDASAHLESLNGSHSGTSCDGGVIDNNSWKNKKRKKENKPDIDQSYLVKVDELVKIKQKQDEDKATVRLHSFNFKMNESSTPSSDRIGRMQSLRSTNSGKQLKSSHIQEHVVMRHPEVVLCVEIYHNKRTWMKTQEFLVLGGQTLTAMRDKIYCLTDQVMQKEGQHDPSGYFLIEDVFCNDLRYPSAVDYSEPIFDWLRNSKDDALRKWECILSGNLQQKQKMVVGKVATPHLPQFRRVDMQMTRFCDLRFHLGAGYIYCHQGDCKHTIVIRDMRLIHPDDVQDRALYPIVTFQLKPRVRKCEVCKIYRATKVTVDDKWAPNNPCYFCNDCYYLLHYSKDGSLLYSDFSAYDHVHD